jgi:outer membrane protein OmpA-like peptidoglycan-associated protein/tetratricopeptide (TPR) repeat protein
MKQLLSIIAIFHFSFFSFSQTMKEEYATKLSSTLNYSEAYPVWAEMATKSLKKNENNWGYVRKAIEAATNTEQYDKALMWAEKLTVNSDTCSQDWLNYFDLLLINGKPNRLMGAIDSALARTPNTTKIQEWKKSAPLILKQLTDNSEYTIANYRQIKKGEEFCAVPYKGAVVLVSNRRNTGFVNRNYSWTGQYFTDLIAIGDTTKLVKDKLWKEIKRTNPHDGPISFSADNKIAVLTVNQKELDIQGNVKRSNLELKIYREKDGVWNEEVFPYNNKTYSVGHGVLDQQGNLYFASDKPGGLGGVDIYKSTYTNGSWSEPVNLGSKVNTWRDEVFPFVSNNGTLYFSSNGWPGNGGLDVFYQENDKSNPKHIGNPINTNADDFGIYVDETTGRGFLSSNRNVFKDEIYTISKPIYKIEAEITLTTCDNKPLDKKQILVKNSKTGIEEAMTTDAKGKISIKPSINSTYVFSFAGDEQLDAVKSEKTFDKEGKFPISLSAKYKAKSLKLKVVDQDGKNIIGAQLTYYSKGVSGKKFLTTDAPIIISQAEIAEVDSIVGYMINYSDCKFIMPKNESCSSDPTVSMNFIKKQGSEFIKLENIYYDFDLWNIRPEGKIELDKLVKYMKEHPELTVELGSHTDSRGSDYYNEWLSEQRSKSCVKYIRAAGIPTNKILAKGYGETKLVNKCSNNDRCTEAEHQLNRRTELKIEIIPTIK